MAGLTLREMVRQFKQDWPMRNDDPDTDTGEPTNAIIKRYLNMAQRMIHQKISLIQGRTAVPHVVTYPANAEFVLLDGVSKIENVMGRPEGVDSDPLPIEARKIHEVMQYTGLGLSRCVALQSNKLYLRPMPSGENWELFIWHAGMPADLVAPDDKPTWLLPTHHDYVVALAVYLRKKSINDPADATVIGAMEQALNMDYEALMPDNGVQETNTGDFYG